MTALQKAKAYLTGRKHAFNMVFNKENKFTVFVLADLAKFCRANESTFHPDPRKHAVLEGRREVWLRIEKHLNLNDEELYQLYNLGRSE